MNNETLLKVNDYIFKEKFLKRLRYLAQVASEPPMENSDYIRLDTLHEIIHELEQYQYEDLTTKDTNNAMWFITKSGDYICSKCGERVITKYETSMLNTRKCSKCNALMTYSLAYSDVFE